MPARTPLLALAATMIVLACDAEAPLGPAADVVVTSPVSSRTAPVGPDLFAHITAGPFNWVVDAAGNEVTDPDALLWHRDPLDPTVVVPDDLEPLLAPDGSQVTLAEYTAVDGRARAKCTEQGTHLVVHLSGLLPKGVYTLWLALWDPPIDPTASLEELLPDIQGLGAAGAPDGSDNAFRASASGEGQVSLTIPPGPLSLFGTVNDACLFDDPAVAQWHIVGAYHTDGMTHGPLPGPRVEPFLFIFDN